MGDGNTDQTHVEEAHIAAALSNLSNAATLDATNLTNLTMTNTKLAEKIKVELAQNKVFTDLLSKNICGVTATKSEN